MFNDTDNLDSNKFASRDTFDLEILHPNGDTFINIRSAGSIELTFSGVYGKLLVRDAYIDFDIIDLVSNGKMDKEFSIKGKSIARNVDSGFDYDVSLEIKSCMLSKYKLPMVYGESHPTELVFSFDLLRYGKNLSLTKTRL